MHDGHVGGFSTIATLVVACAGLLWKVMASQRAQEDKKLDAMGNKLDTLTNMVATNALANAADHATFRSDITHLQRDTEKLKDVA